MESINGPLSYEAFVDKTRGKKHHCVGSERCINRSLIRHWYIHVVSLPPFQLLIALEIKLRKHQRVPPGMSLAPWPTPLDKAQMRKEPLR